MQEEKELGNYYLKNVLKKLRISDTKKFTLKAFPNSAKQFPFMKNKGFNIWKNLWEIQGILVVIFG